MKPLTGQRHRGGAEPDAVPGQAGATHAGPEGARRCAPQPRKAVHKIAFIGAPGAGKTTGIGAVSDCEPIVTDVPCSDALALVKATTTVAMDYGEIHLDDGERVRLYGLPGQSRFRFMFDVISPGLLGVIVLVDAQAADVPGQLAGVLADYGDELRRRPCVVALNKCPPTAPGPAPVPGLLSQCQQVLRGHGLVVPLLRVDARRREDIALAFKLLALQGEYGVGAADDDAGKVPALAGPTGPQSVRR